MLRSDGGAAQECERAGFEGGRCGLHADVEVPHRFFVVEVFFFCYGNVLTVLSPS
jgi:hypothetical protein